MARDYREGDQAAQRQVWIYDGDNAALLYDVDPSSGVATLAQRLYYTGTDQLMAVHDAVHDRMLWTLTDRQGSVRGLWGRETDTSTPGLLVYREYGTFGDLTEKNLLPAGEKIFVSAAYTGRDYDPAVELYNYRSRHYDPQLGTFTQEDGIGIAADLNRYRYVGNSPTNATDPSGHVSNFGAGVIGTVVTTVGYLGYVALTDAEFSWSGLAGAAAGGFVAGFTFGASTTLLTSSFGLSAGTSFFGSSTAAGFMGGYSGGFVGGTGAALGNGADWSTALNAGQASARYGAYVGTLAGAAGGLVTPLVAPLLGGGIVGGGLSFGLGGLAADGVIQTFDDQPGYNWKQGLLSFGMGFALGGSAGSRNSTISGLRPTIGRSHLNRPLANDAVTIGYDLSSAAGQTVYRHIPAGSTHRLSLAREGKAVPRGWPEVVGESLEVRANTHDQGHTAKTGFTSWSASKAWALRRFQEQGGVVIELEAPDGSVWYNAAAQGAEFQVLVPGEVQGKVIAQQ